MGGAGRSTARLARWRGWAALKHAPTVVAKPCSYAGMAAFISGGGKRGGEGQRELCQSKPSPAEPSQTHNGKSVGLPSPHFS